LVKSSTFAHTKAAFVGGRETACRLARAVLDERVAPGVDARQAQRLLLKLGNEAADAHGDLSDWISGDVLPPARWR
jgi:hypothetical protein